MCRWICLPQIKKEVEIKNGPMKIQEEWKEFGIVVKKVVPARYHDLLDHRLFPYFVFGYPIVFFVCSILAYYFYSLD